MGLQPKNTSKIPYEALHVSQVKELLIAYGANAPLAEDLTLGLMVKEGCIILKEQKNELQKSEADKSTSSTIDRKTS